MVESQIDTLTLDPSFSHNMFCKCSNESCEPILDIYVLKDFQCYNEVFNPMSFDPSNCYLKIQIFIGTIKDTTITHRLHHHLHQHSHLHHHLHQHSCLHHHLHHYLQQDSCLHHHLHYC